MLLKPLTNITVPSKVVAKAPEPTSEPEPLYQVHNRLPVPVWHLLPDPAELPAYHHLPNVIHSYKTLDKEIGNKLRTAFGNKVVIISPEIPDFDLCDALQVLNFQLFISNDLPESKYRLFILSHYTTDLTEENRIDQVNELCLRISFFPNALERDEIIKAAAKLTKVKTATLQKQVNDYIGNRQEEIQELEEQEKALPKWIDRDRYDIYGFDWLDEERASQHGLKLNQGKYQCGIYFSGQDTPRRLTNFVIKPLFHIEGDGDDNRRFTELSNGYYSPIVELPTKAFISLKFFNTLVSGKGNFYTIDGFSSSHLNRLKAYYLKDYPKCNEMKKLGWQPEGFFSYANMVYNEQVMEFDKNGLVEIKDEYYMSMGASRVLDGIRDEDNIYKNDKYLKFIQAEITFKQWCQLMVKVYPDHGMMGISWVFLAAFKDVVFKRNNNCPIPYAYGAVQAGKSKFVESICNFFTHQMPMFNLTHGTDFSFFERLERFRNVLLGFNEFDENTIKEAWFLAMKGAFDGEGRTKGSGRRNKTITQDINCLPVLIGQYLSSKDDNSVLMRSLPCKFTEGKYSKEQTDNYNELKAHEKHGLSSLLCEILEHRKYVAEHYNLQYELINAQLKNDFAKEQLAPKTRVLENYSSVLTLFKMMTDRMDTGLRYEDFYKHCQSEIRKMSTILTESNSLAEFWKVVEFLLDQEHIEQGFHYKIEVRSEVKLSVDRKKTEEKVFTAPKKLMFLRMNTIHALYMQTKRQQTGKAGLNEQTILTYLRDQDYYIGSNPSSKFRSSNGTVIPTSSFILDYDLIGANLERFKEDTGEEVTIKGKLSNDAEAIEVLGKPKLSFRIYQDEMFDHEGTAVKKTTVTSCFYADLNNSYLYKRTREVVVTGHLTISKSGYRNLEVKGLSFVDNFLPETDTAAADEIFGKEK